eukprot:10642876-Lingulodinium_polyedra.AAC.1
MAVMVQAKRLKAAAFRVCLVAQVLRRDKVAGRLARTGLAPQALWGHQGMGSAPSPLRRSRA